MSQTLDTILEQIRKEQNEQALRINAIVSQFSVVTKSLEGAIKNIQSKMGLNNGSEMDDSRSGAVEP